MKVLIAPDKFKGSLPASQVCDILASAIRDSGKPYDAECIPMADGGEGTCEILTRATGGQRMTCEVPDPLGRSIIATYGISIDNKTAYIEMAAASGLQLLDSKEHNPLRTSSLGTGLMIRDAIRNGAKQIVLGVGGSATNDAGTGMAAALGYRFLDSQGNELPPNGSSLNEITRIQAPTQPLENGVGITVLCDVTNPLYGSNGAAFIFAPQKGVCNEEVQLLDRGLKHLASVVKNQLGKDMNFDGSGAGGGIAGGAFAFLNARVQPGASYIIERLGIEERVRRCDLVFSGEGKLDSQSLSGKVVAAIGDVCRRNGKPFIIFCGRNELSDSQVEGLGAMMICSLVREGISTEDAMLNAEALLAAEGRRCLESLNALKSPPNRY